MFSNILHIPSKYINFVACFFGIERQNYTFLHKGAFCNGGGFITRYNSLKMRLIQTMGLTVAKRLSELLAR